MLVIGCEARASGWPVAPGLSCNANIEHKSQGAGEAQRWLQSIQKAQHSVRRVLVKFVFSLRQAFERHAAHIAHLRRSALRSSASVVRPGS